MRDGRRRAFGRRRRDRLIGPRGASAIPLRREELTQRTGAGPVQRQVSGAAHPLLSRPRHAPAMDIKRRLRIPILGLGCGGAGASEIERELAATDGVVRAYVNPATETAYVDYDPSETDPWTLGRAVERAGYRAGRPVEA